MPNFTDVTVQLLGEDGNAMSIIGRCTKAAKRAGCSPDEIKQFRAEAMSGDYDNVLQTVMRWFEVE